MSKVGCVITLIICAIVFAALTYLFWANGQYREYMTEFIACAGTTVILFVSVPLCIKFCKE